MKVKENVGPPPGNYDGKFDGFVLTRGTHPKYVHNTSQSGPQIRYNVKTADGIVVPGSFLLDFDHYQLRNVLGAFGVPANAVKKTFKSMGANQFFSKLEKKLRQQNKEVTVWVRKDGGGWISAIKPLNGTFIVKFERILTRDSDTDEPIHTRNTGQRSGRGGKSYPFDEDTFSVVLVVVGSDHEGASFVYRLFYNIEKEGRHWELDTSGSRGKAFNDFFSYHGVNLSSYEPDKDFDDPHNGLPELEPELKASKILLSIEVENGWITSITKAASAAKSMVNLEEDSGASPKISTRPRAKKKQTIKTERGSALVSAVGIVKRVFVAETGIVDLFDIESGELNPVRKRQYIRFTKRHKLPQKMLTKYVLVDVVDALNTLGYTDLASKFVVTKTSKSKKRRVLRRKRGK